MSPKSRGQPKGRGRLIKKRHPASLVALAIIAEPDLSDKDVVEVAIRAYNAEQLVRRLKESMEARE